MKKNIYADILEEYSIKAEDYVFKLEAPAGPDKLFCFFQHVSGGKEILALLIEDYISGLDYVKNCFINDLNAELVILHRGKTDAWYGVEIDDFDEVYLATIKPKSKNSDFWDNIRYELKQNMKR
jgi:hypothetical protein